MNTKSRNELRAIRPVEGVMHITPEFLYGVRQHILKTYFPDEKLVPMGEIHRNALAEKIGSANSAALYEELIEGDQRINFAVYLYYKIASGHAFTNGNKRTAFWMLLLLLESSEFPRTMNVSQEEAKLVGMDVEAGHVQPRDIAEWVFDHSIDFDESMNDYPNSMPECYGDVPIDFPKDEKERVAHCSFQGCDVVAKGFLNIKREFGFRRMTKTSKKLKFQSRCTLHR